MCLLLLHSPIYSAITPLQQGTSCDVIVSHQQHDIQTTVMMLMQAAHGSGEYLLDDLQEIAVVGSGSSGVVKKVRHKATGQVFVLKVIQFDVNSEQLRRQVMTELKTLYGARHQHIVQYHQSYFANGAITILMEFMDAGTLFDLLQKVSQLCISIQHLGIAHRQASLGTTVQECVVVQPAKPCKDVQIGRATASANVLQCCLMCITTPAVVTAF